MNNGITTLNTVEGSVRASNPVGLEDVSDLEETLAGSILLRYHPSRPRKLTVPGALLCGRKVSAAEMQFLGPQPLTDSWFDRYLRCSTASIV